MKLSIEAKSMLRRIRSRVQNGEWTRGTYMSLGGHHFCLVGMIEVESGEPPYAANLRFYAMGAAPIERPKNTGEEVVQALRHTLFERLLRGQANTSSIQSWNDHLLTEEEDVIGLIDETLELSV